MKQLMHLLRNIWFILGFLLFMSGVFLAITAPRIMDKRDALELGRYPAGLMPGESSFLAVDTTAMILPLFLHVSGEPDALMQVDSGWVKSTFPGENPLEKVHMLGTNKYGQDVMARLAYGLRSSLYVGGLAGLVATFLGTVMGVFAGYIGGKVDSFFSALTNLVIVIPSFIVIVLVSSLMEERSLTFIALLIGIISWSWTARTVRTQTVSLKSRGHTALAQLNGFGTISIIWNHILPYISGYIFMAFIMQIASGILNEAVLSLIGLDPYDTVTLGKILSDAQKSGALLNDLWWVLFPVTIVLTLLLVSLLIMNSAMETTFNPRLRKGL